MAVKDWSPEAMAKFIVISVAINFFSIAVLMWVAFSNIGHIETLVERANTNSHRIAVNYYNECTDINKAAESRNKSIESTLASERRDKFPDEKRIEDLENFKYELRQCGDDPRTPEEKVADYDNTSEQ